MKAIVFAVCGLSLLLGACAAETSSPDPGSDSAEVVARPGITKARTFRNARLAAVGAKFVGGARSFPADGYEAQPLTLHGRAANVVATLAAFDAQLEGTAELPTAGVRSDAQARALVDAILLHLELDGIDNAETKALSAALLASVWVSGKVVLRVFKATDRETDHHAIFLFDAASAEILELTEAPDRRRHQRGERGRGGHCGGRWVRAILGA